LTGDAIETFTLLYIFSYIYAIPKSPPFISVNAEFGLKLTDFTEVYQAKSWKEGDWSGTCEWHDETKGSKLTGVSKNGVTGPNGYFSRTLNIWMGPGFLVPHLLLTVGADPAKHTGMSVIADYVPRGPFPLGSDQTYLDQHFSSKDVLDWYDRYVTSKDMHYTHTSTATLSLSQCESTAVTFVQCHTL